jgi:hypothetical protein
MEISKSEQAFIERQNSGEPTMTQRFHGFTNKLLQPSLLPLLKSYVLWQAQLRNARSEENCYPEIPSGGPVSINLDLTTACNYRCPHCVDFDILNTGSRFQPQTLKNSLDLMHEKGLKSVILIGGGEPTVAPEFEDIVRFLKERDVSVAVVTNGSGMKRIGNVGELFEKRDWVRLSLDSGTDATFQAMHRPLKPIRLEQICRDTQIVKKAHPNVIIGFSYIVTWAGAYTNNQPIVPNMNEMVLATRLARDHGFDFISFKPFLDRSEGNNAEIVGFVGTREEYEETMWVIQENIVGAKTLETDSFRVVEGNNLGTLGSGTDLDYRRQPVNCHMTFFRQILSPLGVFNCPVYRSKKLEDQHPIGGIGRGDSYSSPERLRQTRILTAKHIRGFDASLQCRDVTCSYNPTNWFIEDLIEMTRKDFGVVERLESGKERHDFYL